MRSSPSDGLRCTAPRRRQVSAGSCSRRSAPTGNLGSLIRTSEAIGGAGFILVGPRIDPFDPAVVRASMGALFRQTLIRTNEWSLRNWVRRHRCRLIGASPDGSADLHRFAYPRPTILVLGEEREGSRRSSVISARTSFASRCSVSLTP